MLLTEIFYIILLLNYIKIKQQIIVVDNGLVIHAVESDPKNGVDALCSHNFTSFEAQSFKKIV